MVSLIFHYLFCVMGTMDHFKHCIVFFLQDTIAGIENKFFEGLGSQGKTPKYSLTDLDNENFRLVLYKLHTLLANTEYSFTFFNL